MLGLPRQASARCQATPADSPGGVARITRVRKRRTPFWNTVAYGARPGVPGGLLSAWWAWEKVANRVWPSFVVPGSPHGLLRIRMAAYQGKPIRLIDSTVVDTGAMVCELHCDSGAVLNFLQHSSAIYAAGRGELAAIAHWLVQSWRPTGH